MHNENDDSLCMSFLFGLFEKREEKIKRERIEQAQKRKLTTFFFIFTRVIFWRKKVATE